MGIDGYYIFGRWSSQTVLVEPKERLVSRRGVDDGARDVLRRGEIHKKLIRLAVGPTPLKGAVRARPGERNPHNVDFPAFDEKRA
jgi:hypothetical protein